MVIIRNTEMYRPGGIQGSDGSKLLAQVTTTVHCKCVCVKVDVGFGDKG